MVKACIVYIVYFLREAISFTSCDPLLTHVIISWSHLNVAILLIHYPFFRFLKIFRLQACLKFYFGNHPERNCSLNYTSKKKLFHPLAWKTQFVILPRSTALTGMHVYQISTFVYCKSPLIVGLVNKTKTQTLKCMNWRRNVWIDFQNGSIYKSETGYQPASVTYRGCVFIGKGLYYHIMNSDMYCDLTIRHYYAGGNHGLARCRRKAM